MATIIEIMGCILDQIKRGGTGPEVIEYLVGSDGNFVGHETELWDYKEKVGESKLEQAELVRDILAFHNSFGGFLIIGVDDDGKLRGAEDLNEQTVRQLVRTYATTDVSAIVARHEHLGVAIVVVFIPKRLQSEVPVAISKIGPENKGRAIFKPGEIFFRANDSSQLIRGSDDLRFLMGERRHSADSSPRDARVRFTPNNLPDRTIVFNRFFGRDEVKEALWTWLADPMSRYRVIAGPGGFGKTSAAYSFCEEVCAESPLGFEQVVWLSAKRMQFNASQNVANRLPYKRDYRATGEAYESFETLLDALSYNLPISDEEWDGYDHSFKIRKIGEALIAYPSLIVVDDLDSLSPDDQRLSVELAMGLRQSNSRFLFTTRKNFLAPASSTTEIRGLGGKEFDEFVLYLEEQYSRKLTGSEQKTLAQDTEGSPMFTESIFRLLRLGVRFGEAMSRWKGADGEAVRAASFRREVEQLSWGSKRIIFAISMFDTVSTAEIRQMAEVETSEVETALYELDRLFLIHSKQIGDQSRFGVTINLRRQLQEVKNELIPNHTDIALRAAKLRSDTKQGMSRGKSKLIADTIQQAMAQLSEGDTQGSLVTLDSVLKTTSDSADLWMVYARCLTNASPVDVGKVRSAFQKSYNLGKREPQLFLKWIDFELEFGNSNAAIDVGEKGNSIVTGENWEWLAKRAAAYAVRGRERETRREFIDSMNDLRIASDYIHRAIKKVPASARSSITSAAQGIHDSIWKISVQGGQFSLFEQYEAIKAAVTSGDKRITCVGRMIDVIFCGASDPGFRAKHQSQLDIWLRDVEGIVEKRRLDVLRERLGAAKHKMAVA